VNVSAMRNLLMDTPSSKWVLQRVLRKV